MSIKTSSQIRKEFLDFFKNKEHAIVESAPVSPKDDPTLLFTNAGMNQFKPIFLGEEKTLTHNGKEWSRAADTQKCIRVSGKHNDLEEVGYDTYHHTLFEMLGNWSFGDYFKKEAIKWAWQLLVDEWGLDKDRLYATVFGGDKEDGLPVDDEAIELWKSETNINPDHILKFGKKDNFWEMGDTGPCGPCSEIHVDLRTDEERKQQDGAELVNADDPRVMEIWNLVFIQFNRHKDGSLTPLPAMHVDTGMGFERICAVLQGKTSNYDTDIFTPLISEIAEKAGVKYGENEEKDIAMRVIADHIRAVAFSIADGASPGNDGRGYVIRRILRRAIRYGWDRLNFETPFMNELVPTLAAQFKDIFPELHAQQKYVINVIKSEEKSFLKTLGQGIQLFNEVIEGKEQISGDDAFKLHDTYGFPIDLTELMAREKDITVDTERFKHLMDEQKNRARAAGKFSVDQSGSETWNQVDSELPNIDFEFVGYDNFEEDVNISLYRKDGDKYAIKLSKTPFYAESGGQIADKGVLVKGDEKIKIFDVQKVNGEFIHFSKDLPNDLTGEWTAKIDVERRKEIQKHHSVTHLMHQALRDELGEHVQQKGSLVTDKHLRFDFSHFEGVSDEELNRVEKKVNELIQANIPLQEQRNVPIDEAKEMGAMMLFGEKYGETVRVVTFDENYSRELCGGTHVQATGEIGLFKFTQETSVAAGVRRVEAVCGMSAYRLMAEEDKLLKNISRTIGQTNDIVADIKKLQEKTKELEKKLSAQNLQNTDAALTALLEKPEILESEINLVKGVIQNADMDVLKQLGYNALEKSPESTVTVLASTNKEEGKVYLMVSVTDDLIKEKGIKAGALVGQLGRLVGGGGGGQPSLATAGGKNPDKLQDALGKVNELLINSIQ